jgi:hypothetical protein
VHRLRTALLGATAALTALAGLMLPGTASAEQIQTYPWGVSYHDFGTGGGPVVIPFHNPYPYPWIDLPVLNNPPGPVHVNNWTTFRVTADTCATTQVPVGGNCAVTVVFTPDGKPAAATLALQFSDPNGNTVTSEPVYLYGGGAEYVTTDYPGNDIGFTDTTVGTITNVNVLLHLHGVDPVDYPPPLPKPWIVTGDTCTQPSSGECGLSIGFAPTTPGTSTTSFQMSFQDPANGQPVIFPVINLTGTGTGTPS